MHGDYEIIIKASGEHGNPDSEDDAIEGARMFVQSLVEHGHKVSHARLNPLSHRGMDPVDINVDTHGVTIVPDSERPEGPTGEPTEEGEASGEGEPEAAPKKSKRGKKVA